MAIFVQKCVEIAQKVGFDGWLFNIENTIDEDKIPSLVSLVKNLTEAMRQVNPNSQVIWYDSVTIEGKLDWQNSLNDLNAAFFDVCDGIFLNYTWTPELLVKSKNFNPDRIHDVYVGIDVFGRGCPGGGGFKSNEALKQIRAQDLSAAIFAPAWTHECQKCPLDGYEERDQQFWSYLEPLLYFSGLKYLETDFNLGSGYNAEDKSWWLNLSKQSVLPITSRKTPPEFICNIDFLDKIKISVGGKNISKKSLNCTFLKLIFDTDHEVILDDPEVLELDEFNFQLDFVAKSDTTKTKSLNFIALHLGIDELTKYKKLEFITE
jgi:hypothetical protein